jgi:DNA-directed RNA polymerase specialized sigma24 family protein
MAQRSDLPCGYHARAPSASWADLDDEQRCVCSEQTLLDHGQFSLLLKRYRPQMLGYAYSVLRHTDLVEEAVAEMESRVKRRLLQKPFTLEAGKSFGGFMQRVLQNVVRTVAIQRRQREREVALEALLDRGEELSGADWDEGSWAGGDPQYDEEDLVSRIELLLSSAARQRLTASAPLSPANTLPITPTDDLYLYRALAAVIQPRRDCFILRHIEGLEPEAVARSMTLTLKQVTDHLSEAKQDVAALLSYYWSEDGWTVLEIAAELGCIPVEKAAQHLSRGRTLAERAHRRGEVNHGF